MTRRLRQRLLNYLRSLRHWWSQKGRRSKKAATGRGLRSKVKRTRRSKRNPKPAPATDVEPATDSVTFAIPRNEIVQTLNQALARPTAERPNARTTPKKAAKAKSETPPSADQPDLIKSLADSGYVCECQGRFGEAERLYKQSLTLGVRRFGEKHPEIAPYLSNLAALYCLQKRYREAIPLLTSHLNIRQRAQVKHHPDVGEAAHRLAMAYRHLHNYQQAEPLFQSALDIFRKAFGPNHERTQAVYCDLMGMIAIAIKSGKFNEITEVPPPLDLDTLGDNYSWAQPIWTQPSDSGEEDYSWIKLN